MTSPAGVPGTAERVIGSYLAEIAAKMAGPARLRRDIVTELGAGLADAADAHRRAGLDPVHAARAAIAEFGSPDQVAGGFRTELTAAQARRIALALLTTGPMIGALWAGAALASHIGAHLGLPWQWASMPAGARLASHLAVIAFAAAIGSALFTVATTGRLSRWLPARPPASAAVAASGTAAIDLTLLTLLAVQAASTPGRLAALPAAAAAAASLTRLTLATRAARNCLITHAASP
jgi:hypothetical protein